MMVRRINADFEEALGKNIMQFKASLIGSCPNWFTKPLGNSEIIGSKTSLIEEALKKERVWTVHMCTISVCMI